MAVVGGVCELIRLEEIFVEKVTCNLVRCGLCCTKNDPPYEGINGLVVFASSTESESVFVCNRQTPKRPSSLTDSRPAGSTGRE